jgi:repressor LexA
LPILGRVAAGQPLLSDQNIEGTSVVPQDWVNDDEAFLLKVQGESMIGAHICPGDQALVRRQSTAENGDIVVALLNDEATVKRILFKPDGIVLQPENPAMPPIQVKKGEKSFQILGKVVGILRRL